MLTPVIGLGLSALAVALACLDRRSRLRQDILPMLVMLGLMISCLLPTALNSTTAAAVAVLVALISSISRSATVLSVHRVISLVVAVPLALAHSAAAVALLPVPAAGAHAGHEMGFSIAMLELVYVIATIAVVWVVLRARTPGRKTLCVVEMSASLIGLVVMFA